MAYKAVIFDLDGTLLDTLADLHDALNHALTAHGFPPRSLDEVRGFVGNGNWKLVRRGVPTGTDEATARAVFETFIPWYQANSMDKTRPYAGVGETLDALKAAGVKLAIATNKVHSAAVPLCQRFFPQVDLVVGAREGLENKPAPDMLRYALEHLGVPAEAAVYVGDTEVEIETARTSGLPCVCVAWGFRSRAEQKAAGGAVFADTAQALLKLLLA